MNMPPRPGAVAHMFQLHGRQRGRKRLNSGVGGQPGQQSKTQKTKQTIKIKKKREREMNGCPKNRMLETEFLKQQYWEVEPNGMCLGHEGSTLKNGLVPITQGLRLRDQSLPLSSMF